MMFLKIATSAFLALSIFMFSKSAAKEKEIPHIWGNVIAACFETMALAFVWL